MTPAQMRKLDVELAASLQAVVAGMGRSERRRAMEWSLTDLLLGARTPPRGPLRI